MAKKTDRATRDSRLASGWTLEEQTQPPGSPQSSAPSPPGSSRPASEADASRGATASDQDALEQETAAGQPSEAARTQLSAGALVLLGIIGGLYLLYTFVWFSWAKYYSAANSVLAEGSGEIGSVMQQISFWVAPFAPALWFCSTLLLCRGGRLSRLVLWLLIGLVVLVPLPMFDFGAVN